MTNEDVIRMAREAGWTSYDSQDERLERFADLVEKRAVSNIDPASSMSYQEGYAAGVAAEREACARVVEDVEPSLSPIINIANRLAAAVIRARGNT